MSVTLTQRFGEFCKVKDLTDWKGTMCTSFTRLSWLALQTIPNE